MVQYIKNFPEALPFVTNQTKYCKELKDLNGKIFPYPPRSVSLVHYIMRIMRRTYTRFFSQHVSVSDIAYERYLMRYVLSKMAFQVRYNQNYILKK